MDELITEELLIKHGFKWIMSDFWRKGDFGILRSFENGHPEFIIGGVNKYPRITKLDELKRIYKEVKGEELNKVI